MAAPHTDDWVDARAMGLEHPDTFDAPSDDALRAVRPGVFVKISNGQERFWVQVAETIPAPAGSPCEWVHRGAVSNSLVYEGPYDCGDTVEFRGRHIYGTYVPPPGLP